MAKTLYKDRQDKMLPPLYHSVLKKNQQQQQQQQQFSESQSSQPWYKQSHQVPYLENNKAKVLWDIPWHPWP